MKPTPRVTRARSHVLARRHPTSPKTVRAMDQTSPQLRLPTLEEGTKRTSGRSSKVGGSRLRPFFGYYGGKWRDALRQYPPPKFRTIVEPFAGSAGYAVRHAHPDVKVILCEIDPIVAAVWQYLIRVTPQEVRALPDVPMDGTVDDLRVCDEAKWLIGFWLNRGISAPRRTPSRWMRDRIRPGSFWGERVRTTIANQVESIRHWKVKNCSYLGAPDARDATWFIDPPYQAAGEHYRFGSDKIDYAELARWCRSRPGQVIVCENKGADWLPFVDLADVKTTRASRRSREVLWTNKK
jgi:hypothetical protein